MITTCYFLVYLQAYQCYQTPQIPVHPPAPPLVYHSPSQQWWSQPITSWPDLTAPSPWTQQDDGNGDDE